MSGENGGAVGRGRHTQGWGGDGTLVSCIKKCAYCADEREYGRPVLGGVPYEPELMHVTAGGGAEGVTMAEKSTLDNVIALAKRRGFVSRPVKFTAVPAPHGTTAPSVQS